MTPAQKYGEYSRSWSPRYFINNGWEEVSLWEMNTYSSPDILHLKWILWMSILMSLHRRSNWESDFLTVIMFPLRQFWDSLNAGKIVLLNKCNTGDDGMCSVSIEAVSGTHKHNSALYIVPKITGNFSNDDMLKNWESLVQMSSLCYFRFLGCNFIYNKKIELSNSTPAEGAFKAKSSKVTKSN